MFSNYYVKRLINAFFISLPLETVSTFMLKNAVKKIRKNKIMLKSPTLLKKIRNALVSS